MSPEAQRIAIAEACGWQHRMATRETPVDRGGMRLPNHFSIEPIETWWKDGDANHTGVYCEPPRFVTDLNAIHEAEKILTRDQLETYGSNLSHLSDNSLSFWCPEFKEVAAAAMLPADKRAEAFLKTLNLWDDSK